MITGKFNSRLGPFKKRILILKYEIAQIFEGSM
jgi:hypothetical protein